MIKEFSDSGSPCRSRWQKRPSFRTLLVVACAFSVPIATLGQELVNFEVAKLKIIVAKTKPDKDKIVAKGSAVPASGVLDLVGQAVTVSVGPFVEVLPPGSLERKNTGSKTRWLYKGRKGAISKLSFLRKGGEVAFKLVAKGLNLPEIASPLTVTLTIGSDANTQQLALESKDTSTKTLFKFPPSKKADADGDGFSARDGDCDDQNAAVAPKLVETCDGFDNDCNGAVDDGLEVRTGSDVGLCRARVEGCVGGAIVTVQSGVGPKPEVCDDGLDQDCDGGDCFSLQVSVDSPVPGSVTGAAQIDVSGSVHAAAQWVIVNGVTATIIDGQYVAQAVPLESGGNLLTATAADSSGRLATASTTIVRDVDPPVVVINVPADGGTVSTPTVSVAGAVNDLVIGTVNAEQAQVVCNSTVAAVANRTFAAAGVALSPGSNTITCIATDQAGNSSSASVGVTFDAAVDRRILPVSGELQSGVIGEELANPIVVQVNDASGTPVVGTPVIFRVIQNDGLVVSDAAPVRAVSVDTDGNGQASVRWILGRRAGAGLNLVRAAAVGFDGSVVFCAQAATGPPGLIVADAGNGQVGVVGQRLAEPLFAVVIDDGSNRVAGIPVSFTVVEGGGTFGGETTVTIDTDSDGRALAFWHLGPETGAEANLVEATFSGNSGFPASFTATGVVPGDPADTRVVGIVLDNTDRPVPGVTMTLLTTVAAETVTDGEGKFAFDAVAPGRARLGVDGTTTTRSGVWPELHFDLEVIPGRDNSIQRGPIYLLPINMDAGVFVDETTGATLTLAEAPGFALEIVADSVTFPGGTKSGVVSATMVHGDKVPMTPGFGQQPRFIVTIQPAGALFDPPARLTLPNTDGLSPGQITEMYSFDHDLNQFVAIGTGSVSDDGSVIESDPGIGILKAGWHCGGDPNPTGSAANCPECHQCIGNRCRFVGGACSDGDDCTFLDSCLDGACQPGTPIDCDDGDACTEDLCQGPLCSNPPVDCAEGPFDDFCTGNSCDSDTGCDREPKDCDDGNQCTEDSCVPIVGDCTNTNPKAGQPDQCDGCGDGTTCDADNDKCTQDTCVSNVCTPGGPADCDDGNDCTEDTCDPAAGCQNDNTRAGDPGQCEGCSDRTPCDNGNACTETDMCKAGQCLAGMTKECSDDNRCTEDTCDPDQGCLNEERTGSCDDGDSCTLDDECMEMGSAAGALQTSGGSASLECVGQTSTCGNGMVDGDCEEQCDGEDDADCPGSCSADCKCCDVQILITEPSDGAYTCVGESLTVRGTVSENTSLLVNGVFAEVSASGDSFAWEATITVPDGSGAFSIQVVGAGEGCQTAQSVENIAIAVGGISVEPAGQVEEVDDGDMDPETLAFLVVVPRDDEIVSLASIHAEPEPAVAESELPTCWQMAVDSGDPETVLSTFVARSPARVVSVEVEAGQASSKKALIAFTRVRFAIVVTEFDFGFAPPVLSSELGVTFYRARSLQAQPAPIPSTMVVETETWEHASVYLEPEDPLLVVVEPDSVVRGSEARTSIDMFALDESAGTTLLHVNLGGESGPGIPFYTTELRVYQERHLNVTVVPIVEVNDDIDVTPPSGLGMCIDSGPNGEIDSDPQDDDQIVEFEGRLFVAVGSNGRCDTTANNTNLVPVTVELIGLEAYLNDVIYEQAVTKVHVTIAAPVEVNYDVDRDGGLQVEGGGLELGRIAAFADVPTADVMVYLVNTISDDDVVGYCEDLGSRQCAVQTSDQPAGVANTMAHEIGHSLGLPHEYALPPVGLESILVVTNLMVEAETGEGLNTLQWEVVNKGLGN